MGWPVAEVGDGGVPAVASGCLAATKRGEPCRTSVLPGGDYCAFHDPALADRRQQARAEGARKRNRLRSIRSKRAPLDSAAGLARFTDGVIHGAVEGTIAVDVARVALYGVSVLRQVLETHELERRLAALEAAVGGGDRRWA